MLEVVKVDPFSPTSYCYRCRHLFKEGDEVETVSVPIFFRYGKQRKKAKANTHHTHTRHVKCLDTVDSAIDANANTIGDSIQST